MNSNTLSPGAAEEEMMEENPLSQQAESMENQQAPQPEAAPAENPFVGAWEVLYYIEDGKAYTPEELGNTQMMKITVAGIISYTIDNEASPLFTYTVEDGVLVTAGTQFVLQGDDLIVGTYETGSVLLTRIDPIMLNNPFIGTANAATAHPVYFINADFRSSDIPAKSLKLLRSFDFIFLSFAISCLIFSVSSSCHSYGAGLTCLYSDYFRSYGNSDPLHSW